MNSLLSSCVFMYVHVCVCVCVCTLLHYNICAICSSEINHSRQDYLILLFVMIEPCMSSLL
jgi:hypothetical protein